MLLREIKRRASRNAQFDFCPIFGTSAEAAAIMLDLAPGTFLFFPHERTKPQAGKLQLRLRKRLTPALELRRQKMQESERNNVKYLRNVFPDSQWE